ncbi:MAG: T9SS type A sorting domain-containing protein [Flavobacteriaceae bacterium]
MKRSFQIFASFFILLASFASTGYAKTTPAITTISYSNSDNTIVNLIYKNGLLNIKGLTGIGNITIYSIIGNEVAAFNNVNLVDFQRNISLEAKTMYIVRIEVANEIKTYKLVTR